MTQNKILDPKNDVVFQMLFGVKEHENLLISFLNSILSPDGHDKIKSVTIEEKSITPSMIASEKLSILDINVTTESNTHINVEMQLVNQYNMIERTIYYLSKMINKQLSKGDNYCQLNKTITINILDFDYINSKEFHSSFRFYENISNQLLTDKVEIRFIELKKFARVQKNYNDKLHRCLSFLLNPKGKEIDILRKKDNEIKEAMDVLYQISGDSQAVILAELREKAIKDEVSRLQGAKDEGISEGASKLLIKQLTKKFGILSNEILESLKHLSLDSLEKIADDIFDITSLNDLKKYL